MRKLILLTTLTFLPLSLSAQTADEVLAKYFSARGGLEKIKGVHSEREAGTISFGPGVDGSFLVERQRPMKLHMEVGLNGQIVIRTYDGKSAGWIYNSFEPNPTVQPMSEGDLRSILDEADFEGPFVDYRAKGNQVEFAGKDEVEGKPTHKLKLTNRNGEVSFFSFDAASGLLLKWQGHRKIGDKDSPWESYFRDYREVGGLKYPFLIEFDAPGTGQVQKITAKKIEVNVAIDEASFGKPEPPAPLPPPVEVQPPAPAKPN